MKVAVMTDSTAYIPKHLRKKYNIHMVPLSVTFEDETYREEIDITTEEFYEKMKQSKELPTTSQPSVGHIVSVLEKLSEDYDAVISVHLSSKISGTYQAVVTAAQMVDSIKVYPYDSEISCMPQGLYAIHVSERAQEGKSPEEIINHLDQLKENIHAYFIVDDLTNLQRGGRLSHAQALLGSLLKVKPVLHFVDKVIVPFEKIRTRKKAIQRVMGMLEEEMKAGNVQTVMFIHANDEQTVNDLRDGFTKKYPDVEILMSYFGPVIGTHVGEGAIGIGWINKF